VPASTQRLLAYLALQQRGLRRSHVAAALWADATEARASGNLRTALWRLRDLPQAVVDARWDSLTLSPDVVVDVNEASRLARSLIEDRCALGDVPDQRWFEGELLPGWYEDWVLIERERHRQVCVQALEALSAQFVGAGLLGRAVLAALAAIGSDPLRESAYRALITAHLAQGNACEAVRQYRHYCQLAHRALGIEPTPQMNDLMTTGGFVRPAALRIGP
jgi:DNA-binding SARP family transcriptional activator